jgi:hypothetical protein
LYAAAVPQVFRTIAGDPRDVRVLELPTGIRDGTSSAGNYSASAQFHQTVHGKSLVGGYLSRVSGNRVRASRRVPVMDALFTLSAGESLSPDQRRQAWARRRSFLKRSRLGYVVIDTARASPRLRHFAIRLLGLVKLEEDGTYELYAPSDEEPAGGPEPEIETVAGGPSPEDSLSPSESTRMRERAVARALVRRFGSPPLTDDRRQARADLAARRWLAGDQASREGGGLHPDLRHRRRLPEHSLEERPEREERGPGRAVACEQGAVEERVETEPQRVGPDDSPRQQPSQQRLTSAVDSAGSAAVHHSPDDHLLGRETTAGREGDAHSAAVVSVAQNPRRPHGQSPLREGAADR